jgi:acetyl esterase
MLRRLTTIANQRPATIAFSADVDPLRDDARLYVEKLQAVNVSAQWINEAGLVHD